MTREPERGLRVDRGSGLGWALAFLLALWALAASPARAGAPTVILLSWDGTRWDYPDRRKLPALERMAREGVRAERLIPVFPTSTFPNHVSLATGAPVDRHGIGARAPALPCLLVPPPRSWGPSRPASASRPRGGAA